MMTEEERATVFAQGVLEGVRRSIAAVKSHKGRGNAEAADRISNHLCDLRDTVAAEAAQPPIWRCPACHTLYGAKVTNCYRCNQPET